MKFTYETLSQLEGEYIDLTDSHGNRCRLKIERICRGRMDDEQWNSFSVRYKGDTSFHLPQGNYILSHPAFDTVTKFIVPMSPVDYETVISRQKPSN